MESVCVFCGSSPGLNPGYLQAARETGRAIACTGRTLVYGGGRVGLMGAVADAALAAGGIVIGVIPDALASKEIAHAGLTELRIVRSMHERKQMMSDLADAFIALPGGFGTFEEFCEVLTWSQLGIHQDPCGLLNVEGYYDPLLQLMDRAVEEGFLRPEHRRLVLEETRVDRLLSALEAWRPAGRPYAKWILRDET